MLSSTTFRILIKTNVRNIFFFKSPVKKYLMKLTNYQTKKKLTNYYYYYTIKNNNN